MNGRLFPMEAIDGQKHGKNPFCGSKHSSRIKLFPRCRHFSTTDVAKTLHRVTYDGSSRGNQGKTRGGTGYWERFSDSRDPSYRRITVLTEQTQNQTIAELTGIDS